MNPRTTAIRFDRMELAGSLGDLGTLLPIAVGMIMVNGLSATGLFLSVGLFYLVAGAYYGVPIAVQPMKVVGAYALATAATASQVTAAGWLLGAALLLLGSTGMMTRLSNMIPSSAVRGVQLSTGLLLAGKGVAMVVGTTTYQKFLGRAEPALLFQSIGPLPVGAVLGILAAVLIFRYLGSRKYPAALLVIGFGVLVGLLFGARHGLEGVRLGIYLPEAFPFVPTGTDLTYALFAFVLPQLPMTLGNAVIANADLSGTFFGPESRRVTPRALCVSMGLANFLAAGVGGMPLCHGAGGLAAHYRFGARTAGSNLIIGAIFTGMAVLLGTGILPVLDLLPLAVLGVLLFFAGTQLAMAIIDVKQRRDLLVVTGMAAIALSANLAWAFLAGIVMDRLLRTWNVSV